MAESELAPSRRGWWEDGDTSLVSVRSDEDRSGDPSAPASGARSTLSQRRNVSLPSPASYCPLTTGNHTSVPLILILVSQSLALWPQSRT